MQSHTRVGTRTILLLALSLLTPGCPPPGGMFQPERMPAAFGSNKAPSEETERAAFTAVPGVNDEVVDPEPYGSSAGSIVVNGVVQAESTTHRGSTSAPKTLNAEDLREFVLKSSGLDVTTVDAMIASDERYLALIGAVDWHVVFASDAEFRSERARLGIAEPQPGTPPIYTEEGLALVAAGAGVGAPAAAEFFLLQSQFMQEAGLMGP